MSKKTLQIQLTAIHGDAKLEDLIQQLQIIRRALREADSIAGNDVSYNVVQITHNSPYCIELEPVLNSKKDDSENVTVSEGVVILAEAINDIQNGREPDYPFDSQALKGLNEMTKYLDFKFSEIRISAGDVSTHVTKELSSNIKRMLGDDFVTIGEVRGYLERINIHQNQNNCTIYPEVGSRKVDCDFPSGLRSSFAGAVGKYVNVFGQLYTNSREQFPYKVRAVKLDIFEHSGENTAHMMKMGDFPDATGKLSSEDFVRAIREAW